MRNLLILSALAVLTVSNTGCSRCRNFFRRGAPCGGTTLATQPQLGGVIPLGNPTALTQVAPPLQQVLPQNIMVQPQCCPQCCPQPQCCPCETACPSCESGCIEGTTGHVGAIGNGCGCEVAPGEYFGGYVGDAPSTNGGIVGPTTTGSGSRDPGPASRNP